MNKKILWSVVVISGFLLNLLFNVDTTKAADGYCLCSAGTACIYITNSTGQAFTDCGTICNTSAADVNSVREFATKEECSAASGYDRMRSCLCTMDFTKVGTTYKNYSDIQNSGCLSFDPVADNNFCTKAARGNYDDCVSYYSSQECVNDLNTWKTNLQTFRSKQTSFSIGAFMPACALEDNLSPACRDVGIFVVLLINIGKYLFSIVGALALLVMIIAGFQLVTSQGNAEKVKSGFQMMAGAGIGLAIVFGAYMLVGYLAILMGVDTSLNLFF